MTQYTFPGPESRALLQVERASAACHPIYPPGPVGGIGNRPEIAPALFPEPDVSFLFMMCRNPAVGLDAKAMEAAAKELGVEAIAIDAVAEVETKSAAFEGEGRPTILFERHVFSRLTKRRFDRTHADISNPSAGGYGTTRSQYDRLERAYKLAPSAALKSASWGRFQIMGENHKQAGFDTVQGFVAAMANSEAEHLKAFVAFVGASKAMTQALKGHDWAKFARLYNGPDYAKNAYDTKMKTAYETRKKAAATAAAQKR